MSRSTVTWPPAGFTDCPWLHPDVGMILDRAFRGRLYAYFNNSLGYGWIDTDTPMRAHPAGHEISELMELMEKHGYLTWGGQFNLRDVYDESGEVFDGDRMVLTPAGRELHDLVTPYLMVERYGNV